MSSDNQKELWRKASEKYRKSEKGIKNSRKNVLAYKKRFPEKNNARKKVYYRVQTGEIIKPDVCEFNNEDCKGILHAHHDDYSKPLDVRWLCRFHHVETHGRLINLNMGSV